MKIKIRTIIILITLCSSMVFSQEIGKFRTTQAFTMREGSNYLPDALGMHIVANYYFTKKFEQVGMKWWQADLATFSLGLAWEVKDGFIPVEKVNVIGGDGFSYSDIYVNAGIIVVNRLLNYGLSKLLKQ